MTANAATAPALPQAQHRAVTAAASPEEWNALSRTQPVLRKGDDTHTTYTATPFRSRPLVSLPVQSLSILSGPGSWSGPPVGSSWLSRESSASSSVVEFGGLAVALHYRLGFPALAAAALAAVAAHAENAATRGSNYSS